MKSLNSIIDDMPKRIAYKPALTGLVLLITLLAFLRYFASHHGVRDQVKQISPGLFILLLGLYVLFAGSLSLINAAALRLCRVSMSSKDTLLLTMYSSVINFFGPLQSGPAFRAIYLNKKYGVKIKDYTRATFIYYFFYGLFSIVLLLSSLIGKWLLIIGAIVVLIAYFIKKPQNIRRLDLSHWYYMAFATLIQVLLLVTIFYFELKAVSPTVGLNQVLTYTGAANLALFVSITPGAIGFRESFLLFSEKLHHIGPATIVAANLIDRSVYIILLIIMAVFIFGTHLNRQLKAVVKQ